ncbi:RSP_7527 family protein [Falsihalocynthiibacter sp. SS001]|uniref:RSP_7527 family protein n=1 Tax=Falsihalocynthiibacter sp. SS001 TaxID=3349698 RepID=UPI0036D4288F
MANEFYTPEYIDMQAIEKKARQLRAEAFRAGLKSAGDYIRRVLHIGAAKPVATPAV